LTRNLPYRKMPYMLRSYDKRSIRPPRGAAKANSPQFSAGCTDSKKQSDAERALRCALREAIRASHVGTAEIAHRMSVLLDFAVTPNVLYQWTAPGRATRFPLSYLGAFCDAVGSDSLKRLVIGEGLRAALEVGERAIVVIRAKRGQIIRIPHRSRVAATESAGRIGEESNRVGKGNLKCG
jgi:hypothetical protein